MSDDTVHELLSMLRSMGQDFRNQAKEILLLKESAAEVVRKLDLILAAFPEASNGGLMAHRIYHETKHKDGEDSHRTREAVKNKLITTLAVLAVTFLVTTVWELVKLHMGAS
jgi:hypothetical protein